MSEDDNKLVTLVQVASLFGIPYITAYQQVRWGHLHAALIHNRYMVHMSEVERSRVEGLSRHRERKSSLGNPKTPTE